jgi:hypothetical protein
MITHTMQGTQSTAAASTTQNVLTGQIFERAPVNGMARFAFTAEAAGESRVIIYVGGRVVMQESNVSRAAVVPLIPDHVLTSHPVRAGEQITISHRNTGAGANVLFWRVDFAR